MTNKPTGYLNGKIEDLEMNLEETKTHIDTELELPFPWKLEHIHRGDHAITAADGTFLYHDILWFYIQALEREVERLKNEWDDAVNDIPPEDCYR